MNPKGSPIEGGRRPGDDPFLTPSGGQLALLLGALAVLLVLFLLRAGASSSSASGDPAPVGAETGQGLEGVASPGESAAQAPGPGGWTGRAGEAQARPGPALASPMGSPDAPTAGESPAPLGLSTTRLMGGGAAQRAASRSFQSRRRMFLVEAERMLGALPLDPVATPEQRRDRRALEQLIHDMDSAAR